MSRCLQVGQDEREGTDCANRNGMIRADRDPQGDFPNLNQIVTLCNSGQSQDPDLPGN